MFVHNSQLTYKSSLATQKFKMVDKMATLFKINDSQLQFTELTNVHDFCVKMFVYELMES